jgi:streptogramin lyase
MPKARILLACFSLAAAASALRAQTPTPTPTPSATPNPTPTSPPNTFPTGETWTTEGDRAVNASRIERTGGDTTWFMTPSNDRIVRLQGNTMRQWPIRAEADIGANPVDLQIEGDNVVWFIENGASLIDAGKSIIARLDTTTNRLCEWVLPISRPAGFYRTPEVGKSDEGRRCPDRGKIWIAQTAGVIESLELETVTAIDYRALPTVVFASALTLGPDGGLWMTDFGSNRIIRHDMADGTQKAWTILDPASGFRLNPSDMKWDDKGFLWITEFSGTRVDRFDPRTGELRGYPGFAGPVHLDLFGDYVYVSQQTGGNGRVALLDPRVAAFSSQTLTAVTLPYLGNIDEAPTGERGVVSNLPRPVAIRESEITPIDFNSVPASLLAADLTVTSATAGILVLEYTKTNAYGLKVDGGAVWVGTNGHVVRLVPQTIGGATDQTLPVALQLGTAPVDVVRVNLTLHNRGSAPISGSALYQFSAGAFPRSRAFTVAPGGTVLLEDAFSGAPSARSLLIGPVRLQVTTGQAADLIATSRSARYLDNVGSFGMALPAQSSGEALGPGATRTLFTGARQGETSVFGFFAPTSAEATMQLVASDGTVRGVRSLAVESNVAQEYNPAASFFGVAAQPGDVIRISVTSGTLQPYVNVQDAVTRDLAYSAPVAASASAVIPNAGSTRVAGGAGWASGLFLSNPDAAQPASVTASYYPLGGEGPPLLATLSLPPGGSQAILDVVSELFHAGPGQGAIVLSSSVPVAASLRISLQPRVESGQYASLIPGVDGARSIPAGGAVGIGIPNTSTRRTSLFLFNRGASGTVTITGVNGSGQTVGQLALPVGSGAGTRVDRIFPTLGAPGTGFGHIRVAASAGMQVYAQTVEVDAITGDTDPADLR